MNFLFACGGTAGHINTAIAVAVGGMMLTSCDDFLDQMPDNRTTISSEEKVKSLLMRKKRVKKLA